MSVAVFLKSGLVKITNPTDVDQVEVIHTPSGTYTIRANKGTMVHILNLFNAAMDNSEYVFEVIRLLPGVVIIGSDPCNTTFWIERDGIQQTFPVPSIIGLGSDQDQLIASRYIELYINEKVIDFDGKEDLVVTALTNLNDQGVLPGDIEYIVRR